MLLFFDYYWYSLKGLTKFLECAYDVVVYVRFQTNYKTKVENKVYNTYKVCFDISQLGWKLELCKTAQTITCTK